MSKRLPRIRFASQRRGAILVLIALFLPVLFIFSAFIVNLSYMELTRAELRVASDAATRAAGRALLDTGSEQKAVRAAREAASRNRVAGKPLKLRASDVVFGEATRTALDSRYQFTPGGNRVNAVQINASRAADSQSGAVSLIMPGLGKTISFTPEQFAISSQVELDIALVLDRSGSMAYGDFEDSVARAAKGLGPEIAPPGWWFGDPAPRGSRWLDLVGAVDVFLKQLDESPQDEFVTLVTYNHEAKLETALSSRYADVSKALAPYSQRLDEGGTNVGGGIVAGVSSVMSAGRPWAAKVIIVMTDGKHNTGSSPESRARAAFKDGIAVYTITFSGDAETRRMEEVADQGGGKHFHAARKADLIKVFREIARSLPTLLTR